MAESEKTGGLAAGLAHAAAELAHTPLPYLLGVGLMFIGIRWDGHLHDQKGCFQLQEIKGVVFKVDTCSGKVEELKPPVAQGNNAASPAAQSTPNK